MKPVALALAAAGVFVLSPMPALAQAPTLNRDYNVVAQTVDWHQPRSIGGFRFVVPADRAYGCNGQFFFAVTQERARPIDWFTDPAFDAAMVELGSQVEQECPNLELIFYSAMPGYQSVRKRDGWHLLRLAGQAKLQENAELDAYFRRPVFAAGGPNPLADRGYYAARLVAQDRELSLYQAFKSAADYAKNGLGLDLVLVHNIGPRDTIATIEKDELNGGQDYPKAFKERLNGLLTRSGDKFFLKQNYIIVGDIKTVSLYHYVSSYHVPDAARKTTAGIVETPILTSFLDMAILKRGGVPQTVKLKNTQYPLCDCGGTTRLKISDTMSKFAYAGVPLSAAAIFPDAAR